MSTDVARPPGARKALSDMGRSLLLMAVVIAALLFLGPARSLVLPSHKDQWQSTDSTGAIRGFSQLTAGAGLEPASLPNDWRVNAARVQRVHQHAHLHIGWAVPGSRYAGLDETDGAGEQLVASLGGQGAGRPTTIGGSSWQELRTRRGELMLTRTNASVTVVVTGDASAEQLRLLAASLR